jgi:hypothetical protein
MEKKRKIYKVWVGKTEGKQSIGKPNSDGG